MGLLDDAIREHLDLKRRRGADPAEIERAEREALGPVRRAPEPQEGDAEPSTALPYDDQFAGGGAHDDEPGWDDPFQENAGDFEPFNHEFESEPEPRLSAESEPHEPPPPRAAAFAEDAPTQHMHLADLPDEDSFEASAGGAVPTPHPAASPPNDGPPATPRHADDHLGGETVEYEVEGEFADEPKPKNDDVLEETPEFLQDTPDHDRLWFEQRPPRDFDFDG